MRRKRRTREHVIADLGTSHVERTALACGFTIERIVHDYGVDLLLFTYDESGQAEPGLVLIQVKTTTRIRMLADGRRIAFPVDHSDLARWLAEPLPVILVIHDVLEDVAYWEYVQAHFGRRPGFTLERAGQTVTVHLPTGNRLDAEAMRQFARFRANIIAQTRKVVRHEG